MPTEIWQNIVDHLFDSFLIEERIWRENVMAYLRERAADPKNTGPAFNATDYMNNPNRLIAKIIHSTRNSEPWSPSEDPRVSTKSVILRQQEIYGLICKLSVTSRDL